MSSVAEIFQTCADHSVGNIATVSKKRLIVALTKLHVTNPNDFPLMLWTSLSKILPYKKSIVSCDSIVKLLDAYLSSITNANDRNYSVELSNMGHSLAQYIIEQVIVLCKSQNPALRYRSCEIVATLINYLEEMDDFLFKVIKTTITERIRDKDSNIRKLAIIALCKLQNTGVENDDKSVRDTLLKVIQFEPKADIRRVAIFNIDVNGETFPHIVERILDKDSKCRLLTLKKIYSNVESPLDLPVDEREKIIYCGLSDRDISVRKAAVQLLEKWCQIAGGALPFLRSLDVYRSKAAELVVSACIMGNPTQKISVQEIFEEFDAASILYLRVAIEYYNDNGMIDEFESVLPPLVDHVYTIKGLMEINPEDEVELQNVSFCIIQLLKIAQYQDYADEIGRRKLIDLIYSIVANMNCNPEQFSLYVGLVSKIFNTSKEYISNIEGLLAVSLQSGIDNEDTTTAFLQCMHFIRCILVSDVGLLKGKPLLKDILDKFIVIAIESQFEELKLVGSECLALASFIDKSIADEYLNFFIDLTLNENKEESSEAYLLALQYLFDSVVLRGTSYISEEKTIELLESCFNSDDPTLMSLATEASAKLILMKRLTPDSTFATKMHEYIHAQKDPIEV